MFTVPFEQLAYAREDSDYGVDGACSIVDLRVFGDNGSSTRGGLDGPLNCSALSIHARLRSPRIICGNLP